ncbi:MAG: hypothetical protein ACO32I_08185 [Candidatus Limnocylindrus sp.]
MALRRAPSRASAARYSRVTTNGGLLLFFLFIFPRGGSSIKKTHEIIFFYKKIMTSAGEDTPAFRAHAAAEFRARGCDGFAAKLEILVFNETVVGMRGAKAGATRMSQREFRTLYNAFVQMVHFCLDDVKRSIESGALQPPEVMQHVRNVCRRTYLSSVPLNDAVLAQRWYLYRKMLDHVEEDLARRVEESVARHSAGDRAVYRAATFRILSNMSNENTYLTCKMRDGSIDVDAIGGLDHRQLWPELWALPHMQPGHRAIIEDAQQQVAPSMIQCRGCRQYKVTYYEMQTRSADEPMTCFCTCHNCGKKWKM